MQLANFSAADVNQSRIAQPPFTLGIVLRAGDDARPRCRLAGRKQAQSAAAPRALHFQFLSCANLGSRECERNRIAQLATLAANHNSKSLSQ